MDLTKRLVLLHVAAFNLLLDSGELMYKIYLAKYEQLLREHGLDK